MKEKNELYQDIIDKLMDLLEYYTNSIDGGQPNPIVLLGKLSWVSKFMIPLIRGDKRQIYYLSNGALSRPLTEIGETSKTEEDLSEKIYLKSKIYINNYGIPQ